MLLLRPHKWMQRNRGIRDGMGWDGMGWVFRISFVRSSRFLRLILLLFLTSQSTTYCKPGRGVECGLLDGSEFSFLFWLFVVGFDCVGDLVSLALDLIGFSSILASYLTI